MHRDVPSGASQFDDWPRLRDASQMRLDVPRCAEMCRDVPRCASQALKSVASDDETFHTFHSFLKTTFLIR
eukprot:scaffold50702_cov66-Phaeocystis_antarctica.AAC.2